MYKTIIVRELEELINQTNTELNYYAELYNELHNNGEEATEIITKYNRLYYAIQNCKNLIQEERNKNQEDNT